MIILANNQNFAHKFVFQILVQIEILNKLNTILKLWLEPLFIYLFAQIRKRRLERAEYFAKQAKFYLNSLSRNSIGEVQTSGAKPENGKYLESILKKVTKENEKIKQEGVEKRAQVNELCEDIENAKTPF